MKKIATITFLLGILSMLWIHPTSAQLPKIEVWAYTDRAYYRYGESGTLFITVRNKGPGDVILKNITAIFPWYGWHHETWQGNNTLRDIDKVLKKGDFQTFTLSFSVPSESRSGWTPMSEAKITVKCTFGNEILTQTSTIPINIALPVYNENIMTIYYLSGILTIAVIVVIIELYFVWKRLGKPVAPETAP
jgi:hypothetical protein